MPRGLSTEIKAAIAAGTVEPVYLAYFDFASGAVRSWTGEGDLSYDSQTWSGDGRVLRWPTITESISLVANNIILELSSHHSYSAEPTAPEEYRARTCEIYIGFLAADGSLPAANVYKVFSGRMAELSYDEDTMINAYSVVVESRLIDLTKTKASRYTHQTQLQRFAGDRGLEYAGAAQDSLFLSRGEKPDKPFSRKAIYGTTVLEGSVVFVATSGSGSRYLNLVVAFADHECDAIEQLYLDDRAILSGGVVAGEFVDVVDYHAHLGTDAQTVDTDLQTEVGATVWTNDHRLRGICYVYLRILYSEELFGDDAPAVTARIRGKKLYDPRTATTAYSDNAALAVRDYLLSEEYGFSSGAAEIDDTSINIAANDCDFLVTRADATTEKRYTINGWLDTAERIGDNLQIMLASMAGKLSYIGGVFSLYAGSYALTSLILDDADLVSDIRFSNRNLREAFNGARGVYRTPALDWQEEDYPPYQNATALTADGDEPRWIDLPLPLTTSAARCQRIAKIAVMRSRAARTITTSAMLKMLEVRAGDVISIITEKSGIGGAVYEVRSLSIALELEPRIDLELLEVAAADYAWDAATEETELTVPEEPADSILAWTLARLAAPSATPGSQTFVAGFNVTVSHNETGVTVRYTTDGSEPTESDSSVADGGTIAIGTATTTLKLKSFQNTGSLTSEVVTCEYTYEAPTVSLNPPIFGVKNMMGTSSSAWEPDLFVRSADNDRKLYFSSDYGATFTLVNGDADTNEDYNFLNIDSATDAGYTPSRYRAYVTNQAGDEISSTVQMPNRLILVAHSRNSSSYYQIKTIQAGATLWESSRLHPSGSWSAWVEVDISTSANETFPSSTGLYNLTISTGVYADRKYYMSKAGWEDSQTEIVIYGDAFNLTDRIEFS